MQVTVASDPRFERDGNDLVTVLDLPFTRAALGATVTVETLEGPEEIEVKPGTQPGEVIVLRGPRASPCWAGAAAGDHRIVVGVMIPRKLTDEQRAQLQGFESGVDDATYAPDESFLGRLRAAFR